jgi:phosphoribosylglycinamide formyltransferase 1
MSFRLVVLVSGSGTLLQALIDAAKSGALRAEIVAVGADRTGIEALARAERAGVPTFVLPLVRAPTAPPGTPTWPTRSPATRPTWSSAPAS